MKFESTCKIMEANKNIESKTIENIYEEKMANKYDLSMGHFFARFKKKAFDSSSIKSGDIVLVFCCGTGLDFPHIIKKIGKTGKIIGVDFSSEMLKKAQEKIKKNRWKNIELINYDVTKFENKLDAKANVGVCTLGMSIIPNYKMAYYSLISNIKKNGEIIIGDMQLASGWHARLNPITLLLAKKYGGTYIGHKNSLELFSLMKKELTNLKKQEYFFKSYFYCIGKI